MIPFKKMWEDVSAIISDNTIGEIDIVEKYNTGFVISEDGVTKFVNKDDFVNFWCKMLCFKEFSKEDADKEDKLIYVYEVIKNLPYITESSNVLKLVD
ncbi:hypothetical protein OW763_09865 [Clostridium aestuarii]|uniref:Uncharacterized protein n=1 Tax=Clostridium aestuarii TaxID=338193 RepID=A0ABT4D373_9CLOT|nr:hypothetical protein [Clostridium aestuarii]MCY6484645.1 hypothetical protein [Clostridium aestuarii]